MTNETHFSFLNGASLTKDMYHRWPQIYHRLESQRSNEIRPWRRGRYINDQQVISYKIHLFFLVVLLLELKIQEREATFLDWIWHMFPKCLIVSGSSLVQFDALLLQGKFSAENTRKGKDVNTGSLKKALESPTWINSWNIK